LLVEGAPMYEERELTIEQRSELTELLDQIGNRLDESDEVEKRAEKEERRELITEKRREKRNFLADSLKVREEEEEAAAVDPVDAGPQLTERQKQEMREVMVDQADVMNMQSAAKREENGEKSEKPRGHPWGQPRPREEKDLDEDPVDPAEDLVARSADPFDLTEDQADLSKLSKKELYQIYQEINKRDAATIITRMENDADEEED